MELANDWLRPRIGMTFGLALGIQLIRPEPYPADEANSARIESERWQEELPDER